MVATPANVASSQVLPQLLHGRGQVWGDQAYRGQRAVIRQHAPKARDFTNRRYRYRGMVDLVERAKNRTKSKVQAGRAFDRDRQAGLWLCQSALPRPQKERAPAAGDLRTCQSVHRPAPSAARLSGIGRPHRAQNPASTAGSHHKPQPSSHCHTRWQLSRRYHSTRPPLIQTFPSKTAAYH